MAILSELLKIKEDLLGFDQSINAIQDVASINLLRSVTDSMRTTPRENLDRLGSVIQEKQALINSITIDLQQRLNREIDSLHPAYWTTSEEWCGYHGRYTEEEWLEFLKIMYPYNGLFDDQITARINDHSDWRKSSLLFHIDVVDVDALRNVFGFYPIYVIDRWRVNSKKIEEGFHAYQNRKIRFYNTDTLDMFPKSAIGFILSRNHFTHCNKFRLQRDLTWLAEALAPGGTLMFNFNDCEMSACAELFESGMRSFQLGSEVKKILESLGLELIRWQFMPAASTMWVEVKRPGEIISIKRTETMGHILEK